MRQKIFGMMDYIKPAFPAITWVGVGFLAAANKNEENPVYPILATTCLVLGFGGRFLREHLKPEPEEPEYKDSGTLVALRNMARVGREFSSPTTLALITLDGPKPLVTAASAITFLLATAEELLKIELLKKKQEQLKDDISIRKDDDFVLQLDEMFNNNQRCKKSLLIGTATSAVINGIWTAISAGTSGISPYLGGAFAASAVSMSSSFMIKSTILIAQNNACSEVIKRFDAGTQSTTPLLSFAENKLNADMSNVDLAKLGIVFPRFSCGASAAALKVLGGEEIPEALPQILANSTIFLMGTEMIVDFLKEKEVARVRRGTRPARIELEEQQRHITSPEPSPTLPYFEGLLHQLTSSSRGTTPAPDRRDTETPPPPSNISKSTEMHMATSTAARRGGTEIVESPTI